MRAEAVGLGGTFGNFHKHYFLVIYQFSAYKENWSWSN